MVFQQIPTLQSLQGSPGFPPSASARLRSLFAWLVETLQLEQQVGVGVWGTFEVILLILLDLRLLLFLLFVFTQRFVRCFLGAFVSKLFLSRVFL